MKHILLLFAFLWDCGDINAPPPDYRTDIAETASMITTVHAAKEFMRHFQYVDDGSRHFPTIEQCFDRNFRGDCKTSAVMAKWALECTGRGARIVILYKIVIHQPDYSHAIAVSADNTIMISGHQFGFIDRGADWVSAALSFQGTWDYLTDNGVPRR